MEQQQQQQNDQDNGGSGNKSGGFLCRQSSTRWTPTTDQIRILKDLYYNNGVRSPSADQIQRISARLRQYGKIEGKNVFYWFQNHKARERQKKRFTNDVPMQRSPLLPPNGVTSPSPSGGVIGVGQIGNYGYGSVTMEKSFMDCSISGASSGVGPGPINHNMGWMGMDPYSSSHTVFDKRKLSLNGKTHEETQEDDEPPELETLSLFPMHGEEINAGFCNLRPSSYYSGCWYRPSDDNNGGSLELSLNSYTGGSPGSMM